MAERKRRSPSADDESSEINSKKTKLIQTTLPKGSPNRPLCKYGAKCYRKHPDHLRDYRHPSAEPKKPEVVQSSSPKETESLPIKTSTDNSTISLMELAEMNGEKLLKQVYQMDFPEDFYELWKFSLKINENNPREAFKELFNFELVGPFEVLEGALKSCKTVPNMHLHYRYYYDTPEFMTVIRTLDKTSQFHIGYYRDSPDELPAFVASNDAHSNNRYKICGDNLFAAILLSSQNRSKSANLSDLESWAKKHNFSLQETTSKLNARKKKINCTLLNTIGMVVPVENDIGYRPPPMSKDEFKKACEKFCNSTSDILIQAAEDDLQHVITCIQFANDECDYGEGLEFGLNLFLFGSSKLHSRVLKLLPLAYRLLHRDLFGDIIKDHLQSGRSKSIEDLNEIEKNK